MKRIYGIIAVIMCLLMSVSACAEVEMVYENVGAVSWVYGTNLFAVSTDTGYYITTMEGEVLTDPIYDSFYYRNGYIEAVVVGGGLNCFGLLEQSGRVVVPFEYGTLEVKSEDWAFGVVLEESTEADYDYSSWSGNYYVAVRYDVYHMPDGTKVAEYAREEFDDAYAVNGCLNIRDDSGVVTTYDAGFNALGTANGLADDEYSPAAYTDFREEGKYGIVDAAGNVILPATYEMIYIRSGSNYALVTGENGEGLFRIDTAELVVPAEYDGVMQMSYQTTTPYGNSSYESLGYYCVEVDDKVAFVNAAGEMTCQPKHTIDEAQLNGVSYTVEPDDGSILLVAADGVETDLSMYDSVSACSNGRGMYYKVYNENYQQAIIDWHGEIVIPFAENQSINMSGDGQYLLVGNNGDGYTVYRLSYPGEEVTATAAAEESATEPAAEEEASVDINQIASGITGSMGDVLGGAAGDVDDEETPVDETPVEDAYEETTAGDNSNAINLLTSAVALLNTDAAANGTAAISLITSAAEMIAGNEDAAGILSSAVTLLELDAEANAGAAVSLIESVIAKLQ